MAESRQWYLIVHVAGRRCALPVGRVTEVLRVPKLTGGAEPLLQGLLGYTTLRGELTPVLDLAVLLGLTLLTPGISNPESALGDPGARRLVGVRVAERVAALLVDSVTGTRVLQSDDLQSIALPGGVEQHWGTFDEAFAQMINAGGLVPDSSFPPQTGGPATGTVTP